MISWIFWTTVVAIVMGCAFSAQIRDEGKMFGGGVSELISGLSLLVLSDMKVFREELEGMEAMQYFVVFLSVVLIALGIAMMGYAIIRYLDGVLYEFRHSEPARRQTGAAGVLEKKAFVQKSEQNSVGELPNTVACTKCGRLQRAGRSVCWDCGAQLNAGQESMILKTEESENYE